MIGTSSLLSGATGALGLAGGVGQSDSAPSASGNATSTGGPISSTYGDIRGGGTRFDNGNYFNAPGRNNINPPTSSGSIGNLSLVAGIAGIFILGLIFLTD